ncbi:MAG: hypothetical protein Q6370_014400 [Candidatus Sigynarchaeota archaeon]|jgi:hypothetical protein
MKAIQNVEKISDRLADVIKKLSTCCVTDAKSCIVLAFDPQSMRRFDRESRRMREDDSESGHYMFLTNTFEKISGHDQTYRLAKPDDRSAATVCSASYT